MRYKLLLVGGAALLLCGCHDSPAAPDVKAAVIPAAHDDGDYCDARGYFVRAGRATDEPCVP